MKGLSVFLDGKYVGQVTKGDGAISFQYDNNYSGIPLSLSMPVIAGKKYNQKYILPWLDGVVPSNYYQREGIALRHGLKKSNPVELLAKIGLDCAGAVQFTEIGNEDYIESGILERVPQRFVADTAIRDHLSPDYYKPWMAEGMSWSLSGCQKKGAFTKLGDSWFAAYGAAPTNYIVKPGIRGLQHEAFNEAYVMNLAMLCGIDTAEVEFTTIDRMPCLVEKRFDRDSNLRRIHQEDFCQLLHYSPEKKYACDGGPSSTSILEALKKYSGKYRDYNIRQFTKQLFFNYLTLATDAHAQNYSIQILKDGGKLSPLYDCASYAPYHTNHPRHQLRMAMSIGGENRKDYVSKSNLGKYAAYAELSYNEVKEIMISLISDILYHLTDSFIITTDNYDGNVADYKSFYPKIMSKIKTHCNRIYDNIRS